MDIARKVLENEVAGLQNVAKNLDTDFDLSVKEIVKSRCRVVVTGMGKSGIIGKKIAATLASTGTPSLYIHPAEAYHGDLGMILENDIVIAISNSGETEEIIKLLSFFKDNKNKVIALCSDKKSTLGKFSDYFMNIAVPSEACPLELAPTTSTTATLAIGDALAISLMEAREFKPENFAKFHPGGSLGRKLLCKVSDSMRTNDLPVISKNDKFEDVVSQISNGRLGCVAVINKESNELIGIITDGDVRRAMEKFKGDVFNKTPEDLMTVGPVTIGTEQKIIEAEKVFLEKKVTVLFVVEEKKLIGMLSHYDI